MTFVLVTNAEGSIVRTKRKIEVASVLRAITITIFCEDLDYQPIPSIIVQPRFSSLLIWFAISS